MNNIIYEYYNPPELQHHGTKGMRWGIRRYQNKDGSLTPAGRKRYGRVNDDDIVIKKGTQVGHISTKRKLKLGDSETYLFDRSNDTDRDIYEGAFAKYQKIVNKKSKVYEHKYETTEDLFSPSEERRKKIFKELYDSDKDTLNSYLNDVEASIKRAQFGGMKLSDYVDGMLNTYATHKVRSAFTDDGLLRDSDDIRESYDNISKGTFTESTSSKIAQDYGYKLFNTDWGKNDSRYAEITNQYLNKVRDQGYNALIDDNNRGVYNGAVQPFISLYAKTSLSKVETVKLSDAEIERAIEEVRKRNVKRTGNESARVAL